MLLEYFLNIALKKNCHEALGALSNDKKAITSVMWVNNINSFILDEQLTNREINTRKLRCNTYQMDSHWTIKHKYQSMKNKGNITPILNDTYIPANIINKKWKKNAPCGDVHTLYFYIPTTWRNFWWLYHSILKIITFLAIFFMGTSLDRLISTMGFPILVRWHLYIEPGPWFPLCHIS